MKNTKLKTELTKKLKAAAYILKYKDNWDRLGSKAYKKEIWDKMVCFLEKYVTFFENLKLDVCIPDIFPGPDGGIDLLWKKGKYNILFSIPKNSECLNYYGDNLKEKFIRGKIKNKIDEEIFFNGMIELIQ